MENNQQTISPTSFKGQFYLVVGSLCIVFFLILLNNYADRFVKKTEQEHSVKVEMESRFLHLASVESEILKSKKGFVTLQKDYDSLKKSCIGCHSEVSLLLLERTEILEELYNILIKSETLHELVQNRLEGLIDSVRYIHEHHIASLKNFSRHNQFQEKVNQVSKQFIKSDNRSAPELEIVQQIVVIQQSLSDIRAKFHLLKEEQQISRLKKELREKLDDFYQAVNTFEDYSLDAQDGLLVEDLLENGRLFRRSFEDLAHLTSKQSEFSRQLDGNFKQVMDNFRQAKEKLLNSRNRLNDKLKLLQLGSFLLVLFLFLASFIKSRKIVKSITGIVRETEKIGKDFKYRIKDQSTIISEFQVLIDTLNSMAEKINNRVRKLRDEIQQRTLAEEKLNTEKERLAVTLKSIGDGVITADIKGKITLINKVAEELTGWSLEAAVGQPVQKVFNTIDEQNGKPHENPVKTIIRQGRIVELADKMILLGKDGTARSIADSGAPIRDMDNKIIGVVIVFRDVTEQLQMENEFLKIKKLESLGVLAGGIAHDFNNILLAILGNINLAGKYVDKENKAHELLVEAEKAATRARGLTQQLLTFSRGGDPVRKVASIERLIVDSAGFVLRGSSIECRYHFAEDLWLVDIDEDQMSQVIQNLTLNARHAMPEGGEIHISCQNITNIQIETSLNLPGDKYVKITLSDSGGGIAAENLDKIFDPYFTTKEEGSGLGLAISHSIIKKHNGLIQIFSEIDEGTKVTIYLPAISGEAAKKEMQMDMKTDCNGTIMVMDDENMVQRICADMLRHLGYDVVLADDGQQAIDKYKESIETGSSIDVIIMDLTIRGGMGGKEAAGKILELDKNAKILVASGYSNDPVLADHEKFGFSGAIVKPFDLNVLNRVIAEIMAS